MLNDHGKPKNTGSSRGIRDSSLGGVGWWVGVRKASELGVGRKIGSFKTPRIALNKMKMLVARFDMVSVSHELFNGSHGWHQAAGRIRCWLSDWWTEAHFLFTQQKGQGLDQPLTRQQSPGRSVLALICGGDVVSSCRMRDPEEDESLGMGTAAPSDRCGNVCRGCHTLETRQQLRNDPIAILISS